MNTDEIEQKRISERIIGCAFAVVNTLGAGFLEKVYENALAYELSEAGLAVERQRSVAVQYKGVLVGQYVTDLIVENRIVAEIKAVRALDDVHFAQCLNYLRAADLHLCLLLNFGRPRLEVRRIVW